MFLNAFAKPEPPRVALQVHVGLGKSAAARRGIADLLHSKELGARKVIYAVPRHDLAEEQREAFQLMAIPAMVWKGRTAADPSPDNPDRRMCHDPPAPFDAMEVERGVEGSACRVIRDDVEHVCQFFTCCGYQAQKSLARQAQVILVAHDALFHEAPAAIGDVGLLVLDEGFWTAGLRGVDEDALLTIDGLRPVETLVRCYDDRNQPHHDNTADLAAARELLWKVLDPAPDGSLSVEASRATGLAPEQCQLRNPRP